MPQPILRGGQPPDDQIFMVRGGLNSLTLSKLKSAALQSLKDQGVLGVSVQSSLPGETLQDAWTNSENLAARNVIWWATAKTLRTAGFPLLATGASERHYTVVLTDTSDEVVAKLAGSFTKEQR